MLWLVLKGGLLWDLLCGLCIFERLVFWGLGMCLCVVGICEIGGLVFLSLSFFC